MRRITFPFLLIYAAVAVLTTTASAASRSLVFTHATVIDVRTGHSADESYPAQWISSLRNGTARNCVFGTYRAPATKTLFPFSGFREPCNHPNLYARAEFEKVAAKDSA